jgi:CHAT domain-containing protein/tetratricopeptide (TPR) repeat protein
MNRLVSLDSLLRLLFGLGLTLCAIWMGTLPTASLRPVIAAAAPLAQSAGDIRQLSLGDAIEDDVVGGKANRYQIALKSGMFVMGSVQPMGREVTVTLFGPDGERLSDYNEPAGVEVSIKVLFITQSDGPYQLHVLAREKDASPTRYRIGVETVRTATEEDRVRVRATQMVSEAKQIFTKTGAISLEEAQKSSEKFEEALQIWRSINDQAMVGDSYLNLGVVNSRIFEFVKALGYYEKCLSLLPQTLEWNHFRGIALYNMADAYFQIGETQKALDVYLKRLELSNSERSRAITLDNIGGVYARMSEHQLALDYHQQALEIFRSLKLSRDEAVALNNLAVVWANSGDEDKAIDYFHQALALIKGTGDQNEEAKYLKNLGSAYFKSKMIPEALDYANRSINLSRAIANQRQEAVGLTLLCHVYNATGESGKAMDACNRALAIHRNNGNRSSEASTFSALGQIHQLLGERQKAIQSRESALSLFREINEPRGELTSLEGLGQLAMEGGNLELARNYLEQAIAMTESLRAKANSHQLRSSFMAGMQQVYESYIDLLMQMHQQEPGKGYDQIAFQFSERARARSLLDLLSESRAQIRQGANLALLEKERKLLQRLNDKDAAWRRLRNNERTKGQAENLAHEINDLTTELELIAAQIRSSSPRYADLTSPASLTSTEIQQRLLDENTVLLEFSLGRKQSWLWTVTPDSLAGHKLPPSSEIEPASRKFYELLTARQPKPGMTEAERQRWIAEADAKLQTESANLGRMLLEPIATRLQHEWKGKRLAVVASGALEYVPFAVLRLPETERRRDGETGGQRDGETEGQRDMKTGRQGKSPLSTAHSPLPIPLIADHEIVNLPSASALALIRNEVAGRQAPAKTLAALADPVFEANDPRLAAARKKTSANGLIASVRTASSASSLLPSELARSVRSFHRDGFGRLYFSNEEAEFITGLAPRNSTLKAMGFEANRQLVTSGELGRYRIVHFATHGLINSEHPALSGLVLSLVDENGKPQDGFLRMSEIFNLELPADLVVLSACQTALGKEIKGEGLVGLTRGFMYAGAERVAASLWQVDDQATSQLMRHFYNGMLKEGLRPAAALRAAQIKMSKSSRWSSPYYWAGFVIQGKWR